MMLLSIRPRWMELILRGEKTAELRRTRPNVAVGQPVLLYCTAPIAAVVATCQVAAIDVFMVDGGWSRLSGAARLSRDEYETYYGGRDTGVALHLQNVKPLTESIALSHIRAATRFHPPQTWHLLSRERLSGIVGVHPARTEILRALT